MHPPSGRSDDVKKPTPGHRSLEFIRPVRYIYRSRLRGLYPGEWLCARLVAFYFANSKNHMDPMPLESRSGTTLSAETSTLTISNLLCSEASGGPGAGGAGAAPSPGGGAGRPGGGGPP